MATNSRGVSAAVVLFAVVIGTAWLLLDDDAVTDVSLVPPTGDDVVEPESPLVIANEPSEMGSVVETPVDVAHNAAPTEQVVSNEWSIHWTLADEFGKPVFEEQLINVGALPFWGETMTLTIADAAASERARVRSLPSEGQWTKTSLSAPVALTLAVGHVTFQGLATHHDQHIELRATGPIELAGTARVTFTGNIPVGQVFARDLDSTRVRYVAGWLGSGDALVGWFPPGQYVYAASPNIFAAAAPQDAMGDFTVPDASPQTVHVTFAGETKIVGRLVPPPRGTEHVYVVANALGPWFGLRHRAAFVGHQGDFEIEHIPPGEYAWSIERRDSDELSTISPALSLARVIEGVNRITVSDAGVATEARLTVHVEGKGSILLVSTDGTFRALLPARPESSETYVLPRGDYEYTAIGERPDKPFRRIGTVTLGLEPVELTLDLSVDD